MKTSFFKIPNEVLVNILSYLDKKDWVKTTAKVSKRWQTLSMSNELWKREASNPNSEENNAGGKENMEKCLEEQQVQEQIDERYYFGMM